MTAVQDSVAETDRVQGTQSNRGFLYPGMVLPFCLLVWTYALPYVQRAWRLHEGSPNTGGMPGFYILKTFILVFVVLTALQGLAMLCRSILTLAGRDTLLPAHLRYQTHDHAHQEAA